MLSRTKSADGNFIIAATPFSDNGALDLFDTYLPLALQTKPGIGPAVRKRILAKRRAIASPGLRNPGATLSSADSADLESLIARQTQRVQQLG